MIKKNGLKILDFKSGKPTLGPLDWNRHLMERINEVANQIHQSRQQQANWVIYTGMDGLEAITSSLDELNIDTTTTLDGVEGNMRLMGVDTVGGDPTHLSVRYAFEPRRTLEYVNLDFSITPSGAFTSYSG